MAIQRNKEITDDGSIVKYRQHRGVFHNNTVQGINSTEQKPHLLLCSIVSGNSNLNSLWDISLTCVGYMDAVQTLIGNRCWMCRLIIFFLLTDMSTILSIGGARTSSTLSTTFIKKIRLQFYLLNLYTYFMEYLLDTQSTYYIFIETNCRMQRQ